jgi:hypothetical protein
MADRIGLAVAFVLAALCCTAAMAQEASGTLETPAKPPPLNTQSDAPQPRQTETRPRSPGRPPPESVGPRTTQGLVADAISRSNGR